MQTNPASAITQSSFKLWIISGLSLLCFAAFTTASAEAPSNQYERLGVVDTASITQETITINGTLYRLMIKGEQQSKFFRSRVNSADETIKFHRFRAGQKVLVQYLKVSDGRYVTRLVLLPNTTDVAS